MALAIIAATVATTPLTLTAPAVAAEPIAKRLFGGKRDAAALPAAVFGSYAKGCVAGAEQLPDDGKTWQAMRLSRNRHWAHPELINTVKKLSRDGKKVGWNGLLVGDLTQPRGGPMTSGHASHQAGLDADVWLTPMPDRRLSRKEREQLSATSMLARRSNGKLTNQKLDTKRFTKAHAGIIRTAARYSNVERIFVHPTIKRELCRQYPKHPKWLAKIRAQFRPPLSLPYSHWLSRRFDGVQTPAPGPFDGGVTRQRWITGSRSPMARAANPSPDKSHPNRARKSRFA